MAALGRTVVATVSSANVAVPIVGSAIPMPGGQVYDCIIQANGTGPIYLGDSTVTASGATQGFPLKVTAATKITAQGLDLKQLYIVSATAGDFVNVLYFQVV